MVDQNISGRRSVIAALGSIVGAFAIGQTPTAAQTSTTASDYRPALHPEDAWLDAVPGKHRTFVDCATVSGAALGMLYANNLYVANKNGYRLNESDVAVVVCLRHFATAFALNDAMWGKYGKALSDLVQFTDPKTKQAPSTNLLNSADYGLSLPNFGNSIASVVKRGTHFAVCDMASHFISGQVASMVKADAEAVYKEFVSNLIPNSHVVAAGVVAANRAQEHGYTLLTAL